MLVKAGADLTARTFQGCTALHLSAEKGHADVMTVLMEAGASPHVTTRDGTTPLYLAASTGRYDAVKVLLRAKASPLLTATDPSGKSYVPLDTAAQYGHIEVVRELMKGRGIQGCGGASGGADALHLAAQEQRLEVMTLLADAGVVDTGIALIGATGYGREESVKLLLQQQQRLGKDEKAYVNARDGFGTTALICSIGACCSSSLRIMGILVNAGADTASPVRVTNTPGGRVIFKDTPMNYVASVIRDKKVSSRRDATEGQLDRLEAMRRLLLRVDAVRAVSWLWTSDGGGHLRNNNSTRAEEGNKNSGRTSTAPSAQLTSMLPIMRRRATRRGAVLPAVFRYSSRR